VVFLAAGFETTTAPCAAMLAQGAPENLYVLLSGRRTWPIVAQLLESGAAAFDALVAPGHVSTVMGPEEWEFVVARHGMPAAIAGFMPDTLLAATYSVLRQYQEGRPFLDNCYPTAVRSGGNAAARRFLEQVMEVVDANWRGIGVVPKSGYALRTAYAAHDARVRFPGYRDLARKRAGQMPPGCDCAQVVLGRIRPNECRLYGVACTPHHPIGPCMVSDEGACRIWWASGVREPVRPPRRVAVAG
jgi:hydrogenase expression/formation protein HypD